MGNQQTRFVDSSSNLDGSVILLTGATSGIGRAAAYAFASRGATLVFVARNETKAQALASELHERTGNENVSFLLGDLERPICVYEIALTFRARYKRLDVLFNNAGAYFSTRELTPDRLERTFALNHLSYYILTKELLDLLRASAPSRVICTASEAHRYGDITFLDDLQSENWSILGARAYACSKLANLWFTFELSKHLEGSGVTANCFHPGFVASSLAGNNGLLGTVVMTLTSPLQRSAEHGADTGVWLATSPEVEGITGGYWYDRKQLEASPLAYDSEASHRLWTESEHLMLDALTGVHIHGNIYESSEDECEE